jgi:hypothetical protein
MLATLALLGLLAPCLWVLKVGPRHDPSRVAKGTTLPNIPASWSVVRWTPERKVKAIRGE